ncbi:MAG: hypothetical protein A2580_11750 [Hydrogenophilales bacterium RIFOXYD1_FULL_62_11]|nr:MAG: hypothetical protein A2580_11750 [Hydrogenophilales bacterium RIFOXYD1_FULL_62_11]
MATQLLQYIAGGGDILVNGRTFILEGSSQDGDISVATFATARGRYTGVICVNARIPGKPGAEVWSIVGGRRTIATFAIHEGVLLPLR